MRTCIAMGMASIYSNLRVVSVIGAILIMFGLLFAIVEDIKNIME